MSDWSENRIAHLRKRWNAGATASAIARELGVTRNAVVDKAHRLGLAGRPSPIKTDDPAATAAKRQASLMRPHRKTRAQRETAIKAAAAKAGKLAVMTAAPVNVKPVTTPPVKPVARTASGFAATSPREACAWPIGDPKRPGFHFCDAKPVKPGKPYCDRHCAVAYRKPDQPADKAADKVAA